MKTSNEKVEHLLSEQEKQKTPLKGEVSPEEARSKALAFAAQAKTRMTPKKR